MAILQGTTPSLVITCPQDTLQQGSTIELTLLHKGEKTVLTTTDVTIDGQVITYRFTETYTLWLDPKEPLYWQLRVKTNGIITGTKKRQVDVIDLIQEEVMA